MDFRKFQDLSDTIKLKMSLVEAERHQSSSYSLSDSIKSAVEMNNIKVKHTDQLLPLRLTDNTLFADKFINRPECAILLNPNINIGTTIIFRKDDQYCYGVIVPPGENAKEQVIYVEEVSEDVFINIHLDHPFLENTILSEADIRPIERV